MFLTTLLLSIPLSPVNFVITAHQTGKTQPYMRQAFTKEQNIIAPNVIPIFPPLKSSVTIKNKSTKKTSFHVIIVDTKQTVSSHQTVISKLTIRSKTRMSTCVTYQTESHATLQIPLIQMIVVINPDLHASFSQKSSAFKMVHVFTGTTQFADFQISASMLMQKYANFNNSVIILTKQISLFQTEKSINNPSL